jgi:hypothetical protein
VAEISQNNPYCQDKFLDDGFLGEFLTYSKSLKKNCHKIKPVCIGHWSNNGRPEICPSNVLSESSTYLEFNKQTKKIC